MDNMFLLIGQGWLLVIQTVIGLLNTTKGQAGVIMAKYILLKLKEKLVELKKQGFDLIGVQSIGNAMILKDASSAHMIRKYVTSVL